MSFLKGEKSLLKGCEIQVIREKKPQDTKLFNAS